MSKKILSYRNLGFLFLVLEMLIALVIAGISSNDFWTPFCFLLGLQVVLSSIYILYLTKSFENDQLGIQEILGDEYENASIFGRIGMLKYDENRNVMWTSKLFSELDIHPVGMKLHDMHKDLERTFEDEVILPIVYKDYCFDVYNHVAERMIYFKENTAYKVLKENYEKDRIVVGYLTLDNYDECIANIDERKVASIQSAMRNSVTEWASNYGMITRRFRSDSYLFICDEATFKKLEKDRFVILKKIKKEAKKLDIIMTVSIGIARGFDSLKKNEEEATSAINLAFFRGGDQVVIKSNEGTRFFGGNSETDTPNNKVRARIMATSINNIASQASKVLIMGHRFSDLDSLGGSIAMHKIMDFLNIPNHIVLNSDSMEDKTYRVSQILRKEDNYSNICISPNRALEIIDPKTLLILVDNHKEELAIDSEIIHRCKSIIIIDHHRRGESIVSNSILTYLEPSSSSTVELITELFDYQQKQIKLTELEATIMLSGMLIDTNYFRTRVGVRTLQCASKLKALGANIQQAYEYLEDSFSDVKLKIDIMKSAYQYKHNIIIASYSGTEPIQSVMLAKVGNELMDTQGVDAVFTLGLIPGEKIAISARSTREINVQKIMEVLGGGGHFGMAACQLKDTTLKDAIKRLEEEIDRYLEEREEK